jgi:toxin ParE1/3/4
LTPVRLTPEARAELRKAGAWYDEKAGGLGRDFHRAFDAFMETVSTAPEAFPLVFERTSVRRAVLRRFPFVVFYVVDQGNVVILAVLHERRSPDRWPLG